MAGLNIKITQQDEDDQGPPTDSYHRIKSQSPKKEDAGGANQLQPQHSTTVISRLNSKEWLENVLDSVSQMLKDTSQTLSDNSIKFVPESNKVDDLESLFEMIKELGKGATARVVLAKNRQNGKIVALKQLRKDDPCNIDVFVNEYNLLSKLNHKNIASYDNCYVDKYNYYISTQYCAGGQLLDYIRKCKTFTEAEASKYIKTILSVVNYCHSKNIVHRDLKPGNIMFDKLPNENNDAKLMIIDFGIAMKIADDMTDDEYIGTLIFLPPESCRERFGWELKKGDMWSIGVICYILVCGMAPFVDVNHARVLSKIMTQEITFPEKIKLTNQCKNFILSLLNRNVKERLSAQDALKHAWLLRDASTSNLGDTFRHNIENFSDSIFFNYLVVDATLSKMTPDEEAVVRDGMRSLDGIMDESKEDNNTNIDVIYKYLCDLGMEDRDATKRAQAINKMLGMAKKGKIKHNDFVNVATKVYELDEPIQTNYSFYTNEDLVDITNVDNNKNNTNNNSSIENKAHLVGSVSPRGDEENVEQSAASSSSSSSCSFFRCLCCK